MSTLYELTGEYLYLMELMEDPDVDPQMVLDTLESVGDELETKADGYATIRLEFDSEIEKLGKEIDRLTKRKQTIENNRKRLTDALMNAMIAMDKKKIKTDRFSFTVKKSSPVLVIDDPDRIPDEYHIPQPDKIDKASIKKMLKNEADQRCEYAYLVQNDSLLIK